MTYIRRALKYFIQACVVCAAIIGILMLSGLVSKDITVAFKDGWKSVGYITGVFFVISFVYPLMGYGKRNIRANGEPSEHRGSIDKAMQQRGYVLESETPGGELRYHLASPVARLTRLWEDTITITPQLGGFQAEGLMRDLARVVMSIDRNINSYE